MIKLDDDLLQELGLAHLPPEEKKKLLAHIYETLEMRVGMKLAEQMSDAQLSEFEQFIDRNDEAGALQWLERNFPNYKDVVASEFDVLKNEIRQVAPHILAASTGGGNGDMPAPGPTPPGQPMPPNSFQGQPQYNPGANPAATPQPQPFGPAPQPPMSAGPALNPVQSQPYSQPGANSMPPQLPMPAPSYQQPAPMGPMPGMPGAGGAQTPFSPQPGQPDPQGQPQDQNPQQPWQQPPQQY